MNTPETKSAIASTGVWGAVIAGVSAGLTIAGVKVEGLDDPALPLELSTLFGAGLALIGRLRANSVIRGWLKTKA